MFLFQYLCSVRDRAPVGKPPTVRQPATTCSDAN